MLVTRLGNGVFIREKQKFVRKFADFGLFRLSQQDSHAVINDRGRGLSTAPPIIALKS